MANPALSTTVTLGDWVDTLFNVIFFQQDDSISASHYEQFVSPDFVARVNHDTVNYTQYRELLKQARQNDILTVQLNETIQSWDAPGGSGAGCVGQLSHFTAKNRKDGKETRSSALILANVQVRDGKRVLAELTEITK